MWQELQTFYVFYPSYTKIKESLNSRNRFKTGKTYNIYEINIIKNLLLDIQMKLLSLTFYSPLQDP